MRSTQAHFDLQPVLEDELLRLRPLRPEDWDDLYAVASDPLIWEQHPNNDRYKEEVFKEFFREALESGGALIVIDSKNGQVIGSSRIPRIRQRKKRDRNRLDVLGQITLGRHPQ
jgi:RimJ/RimL family protein N-acetyltransferase